MPWAILRSHGAPKFAIARLDPAQADWEAIAEAIQQHGGPAHQSDESTDEHDEGAVHAPRG